MKHLALLSIILTCLYIPSSMAGMYDGYGNTENPEYVEKVYALKGKDRLVDGLLSLREEIRMMNKNDIDFLLKKVAKSHVDVQKVIDRLEQEQALMNKYNLLFKEDKRNLGSSSDPDTILAKIVSKLSMGNMCTSMPKDTTVAMSYTAHVPIPHAAKFMINIPGGSLQYGYLPSTPVSSQITVVKYALLASYLVSNNYKNIGEAIKKHPDLLNHLSLIYPAVITEAMHTAEIKNSLFYDANNGEPRLWMPNTGFIYGGNPVVGKTPISHESKLFTGVSGQDYRIRGLDLGSSVCVAGGTNVRLSSKGNYLAYQNWLGKLTPQEKIDFDKWNASERSASLDGFTFIKPKDLQTGDIVNWKNFETTSTGGSATVFVAWLDKSAKNPVFLTVDVNQYDTYLDGTSIRPVTLYKANRISSFLRKPLMNKVAN